ncbi:hypothetical protein FS842_004489 [Serendipita sp. 407]|nr:hypothetical protein FRC15_005800 [Serendipita sp. 397]KAG9030018.1 hypothetical protein FS842_004489 [Serendipita sp. 407]
MSLESFSIKTESKEINLDTIEMDLDEDSDRLDSNFIRNVMETLELLTSRIMQLQIQVEENKLSTSAPRGKVELGNEMFCGDTHGRRKGGKRSIDINRLRKTLRRQAHERLGIDVKQPCGTWPSIDRKTSERYDANELPELGPTLQDFVLDWEAPGLTKWTRDCVTLFSHEFCSLHRSQAFPELRFVPVSAATVKESFRDYVLYLKRRYLKEQTNPRSAAKERADADRRSRIANRRRQLLGRRLALMHHHKFPEDSIKMVEGLDIDGMSSEQSEGDVGSAREFRIKQLPWRSPDLTAFLHRIDKLPTKNGDNKILRQRSNERRRVTADLRSTRRLPISGLPVNLYRSEWLQGLSERDQKRLNVVDKAFKFPKIDDYCR